ncbi:MAG: cupin domain-containing protein [Patescibacteria group bacterium]
MSTIKVVNLQQKLSLFKDQWSPKIVAELNDSHVKVVKVQGEFVWHKHDNEDEMFLVINGELKIELRDGVLDIKPGELVVIPRGVEHRPVAASEVSIVLIEPKGTVNTGTATDTGDKKSTEGEWI